MPKIQFNWKETKKNLPTTLRISSSDLFFIANYQLYSGHYHSNGYFYVHSRTGREGNFSAKEVQFWSYADEVNVNG